LSDKKVILILQARMGSTRLPGKSMMSLAGVPLVGRILERLKRVRKINDIILATTEQKADDVLVGLAREYDVRYSRGSQNDLVDRFYQAAKSIKADVIVRFPGDNPVPEPKEIDRIIDYHLSSKNHFSSNIVPMKGNGYPMGIGAEVFGFKVIEDVFRRNYDANKREHICLNFFDFENQQVVEPKRYRVGTVQCPEAFRRPELVLHVDTIKEYKIMNSLYEYLYPRNPEFHIIDVIQWFDNFANKV
jgi:spore coat polysaccharide biosynthesis protein SpsF